MKTELFKPPLPRGMEDTPEIREKIMKAIRTAPVTEQELERLSFSFR